MIDLNNPLRLVSFYLPNIGVTSVLRHLFSIALVSFTLLLFTGGCGGSSETTIVPESPDRYEPSDEELEASLAEEEPSDENGG